MKRRKISNIACSLRDKASFILECVGFVIAVVALVVSCRANDMTKHALKTSEKNEKRLNRMECYDKLAVVTADLAPNYLSMLTAATRIHNNLGSKANTGIHTDFQSSSMMGETIVRKVFSATARYQASCDDESKSRLQLILDLASMKDAPDLAIFREFTGERQNKHQANWQWLLRNEIGDGCCPNI